MTAMFCLQLSIANQRATCFNDAGNSHMSQDHSLMASRYELKYLIPHWIAIQARDFVRQHFDLDEYGDGRRNFAYPVHSLYLDSEDWRIFWRTVNGDKNRFKLRLRYYNEDATSPIF